MAGSLKAGKSTVGGDPTEKEWKNERMNSGYWGGNEGGLEPDLFKVFKHHQCVRESTAKADRRIRREATGFSPQNKVS